MDKSTVSPRTVIVDSGRSRVKVLHGSDRLDFPAVVAPGREFSMPVRANDPLGAIHLEIKSVPNEDDFPSGSYFVGDLAVAQARSVATQDRARDKSNETNLILIIAAASLVANVGPIRLVTNLPARDWARQRTTLADSLRGVYLIHHLRGLLAGMKHEIEVEQVVVLPEGAAAFFGALYDWQTAKPIRPELAEGSTLVIDIGDTTCNYVWMDNQDYRDEQCGTVDHGLHRANAAILTRLQTECDGADITLPELEALLRQADPVYRHGNQRISLAAWRREAYSAMASRIASELQARLHGTPNHVLLVGGGGQALAEDLRGRFGQADVVCPGDPVWLNAYGMAVMLRLAGDGHAAA